MFSVSQRSDFVFGGVLRGRFVPRTWLDRVPAGTVLAGTRLFRTRSDYKKWCVPRTCSENMFPLELYREQVWTPGLFSKSSFVWEWWDKCSDSMREHLKPWSWTMAFKWALDISGKGLRASWSGCELHTHKSFAPPLFENPGSAPVYILHAQRRCSLIH